eukprot:52520-Eustigmatos_ZCMA.PRE.1
MAFAACIVVLALGQTITGELVHKAAHSRWIWMCELVDMPCLSDVVGLHNKPGDSSSDEWSALFFLLVNWVFNVVLEVSCLMKRDREAVNRLENALA